MPISDFLATAGRGTAVGQIAEAFGGRTPGQLKLDNFINKDLPAFAEQFKRAQTLEEIRAAEKMFAPAALNAGIPFAGVEKLQDLLTKPALEDLRQGEYDKIISEYGPRPSQPRPEGVEGPLTEGGDFVPPAPGKPFDQQAALRLGKFGGIPAGLSGLLRTPAEVAMKETSQAKTQAEVDALKARQEGLKEYSNIPPPGAMVSPRQMARDYPQGLTQFNPQREKADDPLLPLRERLLESQINRTNRPDKPERRRLVTRDLGDRVETFDPETGEITHSAPKGAVSTATEAAGSPKESRQAQIILTDQAIEAGLSNLPPAEQAAGIKKLASDMGYEIDGDPRLGVVPGSGFLGSNKFGNVGILGITGMKKKAKTVTRAPAGAAPAAKAKDDDPLGIRPKR